MKRRQNRPWPERLNVLDGCEHLTAACSTLAGTLLAECSEVAVLPAFRESLSVPGACDDHGAEARRELGPDGAAESYNAGSRLSLEEAIELVLAEPVTGF